MLRLNRPGYHSRAALESELHWTSALRAEGILRTPAYVPTLTQAPVATLGRDSPARHAVMFSFAEGAEPPPGSSAAGMPAIGEIAARLHHHSRRWTPPAGFTRFSWDLPQALGSSEEPGRWGDWRTGTALALRPVLEAAELRLREQLIAYGYERSRYGLIHADLRAANLLVRDGTDGTDVTVIDFDDCGHSWFAYDLAASVSFLEHRPELAELVAGWLEGYRRVGSLTADDRGVLPALIMLRRLQLLAWSASHAETEMVRSLGPAFAEDSAAVADRYLGGTLLISDL